MKLQKKLSEIVSYNKGQQINGDLLLEKGDYDYLNGGIFPSGKWNNFNVEGNTITISEGGNSCGYVNYMTNKFWCGAHCYYLYNSKLQPKYLFYLLKSQQERLMKIRTGACMPNIKKTDLGNFVIEYDDDISVQNKIIKIFDILNKIITVRNKQLTDLDLLVKSRFVEMFGDPVANNKGIKTTTVGDICFVTKLAGFEYTDYIHYKDSGDVVMIRALNVKDKHLKLDDIYWIDAETSDKLPRSKLKENDIVMTYVGVNIGDVALVDGKHRYHLAPNVAKISPNSFNEINPVFFVNLLAFNKENFAYFATNTAKQALNMDKIRNLKVMLPPLALQNQFAAFVEKVDQTKASIKKSLEQFETLKKKLMQDYFG